MTSLMSLPPEILLRIVEEVVNTEMVELPAWPPPPPLPPYVRPHADSRRSIALASCNKFFAVEIWKAFRKYTDNPNIPAAAQSVFSTPWFDLKLVDRLIHSTSGVTPEQCPVTKLVLDVLAAGTGPK